MNLRALLQDDVFWRRYFGACRWALAILFGMELALGRWQAIITLGMYFWCVYEYRRVKP